MGFKKINFNGKSNLDIAFTNLVESAIAYQKDEYETFINAVALKEFDNHKDEKLESPIELIFFCAFQIALSMRALDLFGYDCGLGLTTIDVNGNTVVCGVNIVPQFEIGEYRCDFLCCYASHYVSPDGIQNTKSVIVECDGTSFHERSEKERRYEKERDRFLQKEGYVVFRFTGKQLLDDALSCANEVLDYITEDPFKKEKVIEPNKSWSV